MFSVSFGSDAKAPFSVVVHGPDSETKVSMLVIRDAGYHGDITIFRENATALADFLAIGRAIVEQCEKLKPGVSMTYVSDPQSDFICPHCGKIVAECEANATAEPQDGAMAIVEAMAPEDDHPF